MGSEACGGCAGSLGVLRDVARLYHERLEATERLPSHSKLQVQVELLRAWVGDLTAQNALLARAVQELEAEAAAALLRHHRRHRERDKCSPCGKVNHLKVQNESLHKENLAKDREIRKLHKDAQQYEQTILHLRKEISLSKYNTPDVSKKDAEVMAGMCCTGAECGDWEPVKEFSSALRQEVLGYQERLQEMEASLKCSAADVRALRKANVGLREQLGAARAAAAALRDHYRALGLRNHFMEDIIREMRRQLKQAKAKSKEAAHELSSSASLNCPPAPAPPLSAGSLSDGRSPRLVVSGEDLASFRHDL